LSSFRHTETDMTIFFRALAAVDFSLPLQQVPLILQNAWYEKSPNQTSQQATLDWLLLYQKRLQFETRPLVVRTNAMNCQNPHYVLRNYLAQLAIDSAEQGDYSKLQELQKVLQHPYQEQPGHENLAQLRPNWARQRAGCSMLSCSS